MVNELNILLTIYTDILSNIDNIISHRVRIQKIKNSINNLNNNYFEVKDNELLLQYLNEYDDKDNYEKIINKLETLKNYVGNKITNRCEHEWVNDLIDIDPDRSQEICYCIKCDVTKR